MLPTLHSNKLVNNAYFFIRTLCEGLRLPTDSEKEPVFLIAQKIRSRARIIHLSPSLTLFFSRIIGFMVKDVILTREELNGLISGLLVSREMPLGLTKFEDWLDRNTDIIGSQYSSELNRHFKDLDLNICIIRKRRLVSFLLSSSLYQRN